MTQPLEDFLAHYGVIGMKWGKRKGQTSSAPQRVGGKFVKPEASGGKKKVDVKSLSDAELKARIARLSLEKQLKEASSSSSSATGRKVISSVLENSGKQAATTVLTAAAIFAAKKAIESQFGPDVVSAMFPRKK